MKKIGIIIGRFQVPTLHKGHLHLISSVLELTDEVHIFIGTAKPENQFTPHDSLPYEARRAMILDSYPILTESNIHEIPDIGNWELWVKDLDARIENLNLNGEIFICGSRDSVAIKYKAFHGKFANLIIPELKGFSGTNARKQIEQEYEPDWNNEENRKLVIWLASKYGKRND